MIYSSAAVCVVIILYILDGETAGDGSTEPNGMCQQEDPSRKCLSTSECRACKFITDRYEGCQITTGLPICDANKNTTGIDYATDDYDADDLLPKCVPCKQMSKKHCEIIFHVFFYKNECTITNDAIKAIFTNNYITKHFRW